MSDTPMKQFWFVWNESGHAPQFKHDSEQQATTEAERLARECPGNVFVVLEAIVARKVDVMQRSDLRPGAFNDDLPF